jgi:hypothetical protein
MFNKLQHFDNRGGLRRQLLICESWIFVARLAINWKSHRDYLAPQALLEANLQLIRKAKVGRR